jgi:hypothetical protein
MVNGAMSLIFDSMETLIASLELTGFVVDAARLRQIKDEIDA